VSAIVFVAAIFFFVLREAAPILVKDEFSLLQFLFSTEWYPTSASNVRYGTFALTVGTMSVTALAMLLACYLALTSRGRSLVMPGLSGLGWVLICGGLMIGAPALGIEAAFPGVSTGGVPAALFLIIAGAAVLQAERNNRQTAQDDQSRLN